MPCESFHMADVVARGTLRVMTSLELLQHDFSKMGHRDLLVTHTLPDAGHHHSCRDHLRASVRRASGFVLTGHSEIEPTRNQAGPKSPSRRCSWIRIDNRAYRHQLQNRR